MIKQVGAVPYFWHDGQWLFVSITSTRTGEWIFPKGQIDSFDALWDIADNEAFEEAGVMGEIEQVSVASYQTIKFGSWRNIALYPMRVHTILPSWQEQHVRQRTIVDFEHLWPQIKPDIQEAFEQTHHWITRNIEPPDTNDVEGF